MSTSFLDSPNALCTHTFDSCAECELGRYQDSEGEAYCILCPKGKFQAYAKQDSCELCLTIHKVYSDEVGTATCKACPVGKLSFSGDREGAPGGSECLDPCPGDLFHGHGLSLVGLLFQSNNRISDTRVCIS
jgi:hypothetical protein